MFCLHARKSLRENICCHLVGRAVDEFDVASLDDVPNEVVPNVDVFCSGMVVAIFCECDCRLAVTE